MTRYLARLLAPCFAFLIRQGARLITGARSLWVGCQPDYNQRIYFANHNSHIDFILLWSSLPAHLRCVTCPVAASDYWLSSPLRRFFIRDVFSGIVIDRRRQGDENPLQPVLDALEQGHSLIFFPEGTRNLHDDIALLPFKSGLYHLSEQFPNVELVPVWISNLKRVMPKGSALPLPILCTLAFGEPLRFDPDQSKEAFLKQAEQAVLALSDIR